jgi:predicted amidophosphoribosyltransferase
LTTGATFLAAAEKLKTAGAREISFLALAALK